MLKELSNLSKTYIPKIALVGYGEENENDINYCESHQIASSEGLWNFQTGQPVTESTLFAFVKLGNDLKKDEYRQELKTNLRFKDSLLESNILWCKQDFPHDQPELVWWEPAGARQMSFSNSLKIPSGEVRVPGMVYVWKNKLMHVFMVKTNRKPTIDTDLYAAPFMNVGGEGSVCLGSTKTDTSKCLTWEDAAHTLSTGFWQSEFTHSNAGVLFKDNINLLWKEMVNDPTKKFPKQHLVKSLIKLKNLCKSK